MRRLRRSLLVAAIVGLALGTALIVYVGAGAVVEALLAVGFGVIVVVAFPVMFGFM